MFDAGHYHTVAQSLVQGLGYVGADGLPYFYRLPGYSFFLAGCYFLIGIKPVIALVIQALFASFIPPLIFILTQVLFPLNLPAAYITSLISCLHVGYVIYADLLMAETLFVLFFLSYLIFFFRKRWILAGIFLGIASLIRPVGHFVVLVSCLCLLFSGRCSITSFKKSLFVSVGWLSIVGWWLIRNYCLTGLCFFHTLSGPHFINHSAIRLAQKNYALSYHEAKQKVYTDVDKSITAVEAKSGCTLDEPQISQVMERVAMKYCKENYLTTALHCCTNIFKTMFSLYSSELLVIEQQGSLPMYDQQRGVQDMVQRFLFPEVQHHVVWFCIYYELIMWISMLIGLCGFCIRAFVFKPWRIICFQVFPLIILFVVLSAACGFARFRLPIEHFIIQLAVVFWIFCFQKYRSLLFNNP